MDREDILRINQVLHYAYANDNYEIIRDKLSLEERKRVLFGTADEFKVLGVFAGYNVYLNLFSSEEADQIYQTVVDSEIKSNLLLCCSDDFKINEIDVYDDNIFIFMNSFSDNQKKLEAFQLLLQKGKISSYNLPKIVSYDTGENQLKAIDIICNHCVANNNFKLGLLEVAGIIENCQSELQEVCLDKLLNLLEQVTEEKIDNFGFTEVIKAFPEERKLKVFNKFIELSKREKIEISEYRLSVILMNVEDNIKLDFVKFYLDKGLLRDKYFISNIFQVIPDKLKDGVLDIFYKFDEDKDDKMINDYIISQIIMRYANDVRLEKFKTLVLNQNKHNDFEVIKRFSDIDLLFSTLNLKVREESLKIEEGKKEEFLDVLNTQIEIYGDKIPSGEVLYSDLINFYAATLSLNKDNFVLFIKRFGYKSIKYLSSDSVKNMINLDKVSFNKIMNLFKDDNIKLDNDTMNNVVHSILQREFMLQCKKDYNVFAKIEELINNSELVKVQELLLEISGIININKILSKHNISKEDFFSTLLSGKMINLDILHEITDQYIMKKREDYVNKRLVNINDELDLDKKYEKNFIKKKYIATTSVTDISWNIRWELSDDELTSDQLELKNNRILLESIIKFKKSPNEYVLEPENRKYLKIFEELLNILYVKNKLKDPTNDPNAKYVYSTKEIGDEYLLGVISELNIDNINKFLLSNDSLYKNLSAILEKYKLLGWNNTFSSLEDKADFEFDATTISGIINYFYQINRELLDEEDNKFSLTKLVSLGNCYASSSSKYSLLFGRQVYRLFVANGGKNKASMVKHKRLEFAVKHLIGMLEREIVPVPPMDENITISNGKVINAVVGNTSNLQNMVLGELTESCSRIGGAFYDFYKECLEGEVGYNIVLSHPGTGEFISRVSGIRNGNTLFLNELRDSVCDGYMNEDCVDAIKEIAKMLVERSKDSEFPIDNVVITADYAMKEHKSELQDLHLTNRKEAVFGLHHNLSGDGKAIVLSTSNKDNSLVEVKLGKDKISYYRPQRDKVIKYDGVDAVNRVVQLQNLINGLLSGMNLDDIEVDMNQDVVSCISGSDWFISIDSKGNIQQFVLDKIKDKDRAMEEMASYLEMINNNTYELESVGIRR